METFYFDKESSLQQGRNLSQHQEFQIQNLSNNHNIDKNNFQKIIQTQSKQIGKEDQVNTYLSKPNQDDQDDLNLSQQDEEQYNKQISLQDQNTQQIINVLSMIEQSHPLQKKILKPDSLQHDIKLGWIPKTQITGPIPLSFSHKFLDSIIQTKINEQKIIYLGYRPTNSFDIHQKYYGEGKNYPFYQFHLCKSQFLERFFKKYYPDYQFDKNKQRSQLNPIKQPLSQDLIFNSDYEGGNLDAVYFQEDQYRLMIRLDSNTKGHCNYYNFKIKCNKQGRYRLRIMNMSKKKSLYERGMKPYMRILNVKTNQQTSWSQRQDLQCSKLRFGSSPLNQISSQEFKQFYSLKFQLELKKQCQYQLCYNIPYTYSQLVKQINMVRQNKILHVSKLGYSLSGVEVPLLTIADYQQNKDIVDNKKLQNELFYVIITGRIHPAESNSSHIVNGLIKFLLKNIPQTQKIRKNLVFKIIPMVNPDGVIIGNTRTGFAGKDLNRKFSNKTELIFPQVNNLKDYVLKMKQKYGKKLLFVIDIHGHSTRKGSFFFGPQYPVLDEQYSKCRLLPKFYAIRSEAFRYYSCKFKISQGKEATSRGFFNSNQIRTYTHETSVHSFYNFTQRKDMPFTQKYLEILGKNLVFAIFDYVQKVNILPTIENIQIQNVPLKLLQKTSKKEKQSFVIQKINNSYEEEERESDKMPSDKADSESDGDDIEDKKLNVFYQRINQNKQYFYDEIVKMLQNKKDSLISPKKDKKIKLNQNQKVKKEKEKQKNKQFKIQRRKTNMNWSTNKSNYTPKKTLFAEYSKMSLNLQKNTSEKSPTKATSKIKVNIEKNKQSSHRRSNSQKNSQDFLFGFQKVKLQSNTNRIIYSVPNIKWENNSQSSSNHLTERNQIYRYDLNDYQKTQLRHKKDKIKHSKMMQNIFVQKQQKQLKINKQLLQKLLVPSSNSVINSFPKNEIKFLPTKENKTKFTTQVTDRFPNTDYKIFTAFSQINTPNQLIKTYQKIEKKRLQQQNGPYVETSKQQYLCKKWQKEIMLKTKRNLSFSGRMQMGQSKIGKDVSPFLKNLSNQFNKFGNEVYDKSKNNKESFPKIFLNKKDIIVIDQHKI